MPPIDTYEYSATDAQAHLCPFSDRFSKDLWIAYHGTSCHAEHGIEADGLQWQDRAYSEREARAVAEIFRQLFWPGFRPGGMAVLATFSASDFRRTQSKRTKPI